jgi:hypothetical protein
MKQWRPSHLCLSRSLPNIDTMPLVFSLLHVINAYRTSRPGKQKANGGWKQQHRITAWNLTISEMVTQDSNGISFVFLLYHKSFRNL